MYHTQCKGTWREVRLYEMTTELKLWAQEKIQTEKAFKSIVRGRKSFL